MAGKRKFAGVSTSQLMKKKRSYEKQRVGRTAAAARRNKQGAMGNIRTGGFMGIELKYVDYAIVSQALAAPTDCAGGELDPATALSLNAIAQGDGENQRDGKQVAVKSCYVTGVVDIPALVDATAGNVVPTVYLALVLDKQTNAAQLNSEDVFTNPGASAVTASNPLRDLQYSSRFQVLDTVVIEPKMIAATYDGTNIETFGTRVPFKLSSNMEFMTNYILTTAAIAAIQDHSLHVVGYVAPATGATISYNSRVRFVG